VHWSTWTAMWRSHRPVGIALTLWHPRETCNNTEINQHPYLADEYNRKLQLAGVLTESQSSSQLRDSVGFAPNFPRFLSVAVPH